MVDYDGRLLKDIDNTMLCVFYFQCVFVCGNTIEK